MDILEFALEREREIGRFYHRLAERMPHAGVRNVLEMLAVGEETHAHIIEQMKHQLPADLRETDVLDDGEVLLKRIRDSEEKIDMNADELLLYRQARDIEHEKELYYSQKARLTDDPVQQTIFEELAREEHKHYVLMDNLCDLLTRTRSHIADAEMNHIPEYVEGLY
jgi:rubrerythrin